MGYQGGGGGGGFNRQPREMHKAVCDDCKKECEVPFKPSGGRPIYCKDCFSPSAKIAVVKKAIKRK